MEVAKYTSNGTTRTYTPPCTFNSALNLGVFVNSVYVDRNDYEIIRGQVLFKSDTIPADGAIIEVRVDNTVTDMSTATLDDISIVKNNIANINSVANRIDDVLTLAPSMASVEIVADNIDDILEVRNTIIPNIAEVLNADTNASIATAQATNATNQASNALSSANSASASASIATTKANEASASATSASTSATTATTKATEAGTYASNSSASATLSQGYANDANTAKNTALTYRDTTQGYMNTTQGYMNNASTSATNASNSATSAANTLTSFNNKYAVSATAPSSPFEGMLWYDSVNNVIRYYDGSSWVSVSPDLSGVDDYFGGLITEELI